MQINQGQDEEVVEKVARNDNVCTLCEEFATDAINFLLQNQTQTEIIDILHKSCSRIPSFQQQVSWLIDFILFFGHKLEIYNLYQSSHSSKSQASFGKKEVKVEKQNFILLCLVSFFFEYWLFLLVSLI